MRAIRFRLAPVLRSFGLLALVMLSACASVPSPRSGPPRAALEAFVLEARFTLNYENTNYSGRLSWRHEGKSDALLLASPFGQGMAEISSDETGARLTTSDGKSYVAADVAALTHQFLGYPLPLQRLVDWVRARDGRDRGGEVETRDAFGRPLRLHREDWRIAYDYADDDIAALPSLIFAERADGFRLRLRIDAWTNLANPS